MTDTRPIGTRTPCVEFASLYQHRLVEDPAPANAPVDQRRTSLMMVQKAQHLCSQCPMMRECLYDAVVRFDVAGFAGGLTARQRAEVRARVGVAVASEDYDTMAGVTGPHRQVDHDEVVRLRHANPDDSLETIALRLGCSLSTVKRHMRKARTSSAVADRPVAPELPSMDEVLDAYRVVVARHDARRPRAS